MIITLLSQYDHVLYYLSFLCLYYLHMIVSFNMSLFFLLLYLCTTSIWWCPLLCQIYQVKSQNREWIRSGHRPHNDHVVGRAISQCSSVWSCCTYSLSILCSTQYMWLWILNRIGLWRVRICVASFTYINIPNLYYKNTKSTLNLI